MEFDINISRVHGVLMSLGNRRLLNSDSKEPIILLKEIVDDLTDEEKAKVTFFMVLNTRLSVTEELKNDETLYFFTDITPNIEKNHLIDYLYELKLESHLNDIIEHCPSALTLELIEEIMQKLKQAEFHKSSYGIKHLYNLWRSIYVKVFKIEKEIHIDKSSEKLVSHFVDLYKFIQTIIVTSMRVDKDEVKIFAGAHLCYLYESILFFVDLYLKGTLPPKNDELYKMSMNLQNGSEDNKKGSLLKCINAIFTDIQKILEYFSVDFWMFLSENHLENDLEKSMQQVIGETVYKICETLKQIDTPINSLDCLSLCSIKPKKESDFIAEADITEIIANVVKHKKEWFKALIRHDSVFEEKSINCVIENLELSDSDDINFILNLCLEYLERDSLKQSIDLVKKMFLSSMREVPENEYELWLKKVFKNCEINLLEDLNCQDELVETFNKIANENNVNIYDMVCLCMKSPVETITEICSLGIYDSNKIEFVLNILTHLKHPCGMTVTQSEYNDVNLITFVLLEKVLSIGLNNKEKKAFISLIIQLEGGKIIDVRFHKMILKLLKEYLELELYEKAVFFLEILKSLLHSESFGIDKTILLVFLSRILGHLSWDLKSFSTIKADGRDLVRFIVKSTIKKLRLENDDTDLEWVRQEVSKSWEVDQSYFCDLWFAFGHDWPCSKKFHTSLLVLINSVKMRNSVRDFLNELNVEKSSSQFRASIILSLTMLLPVLTSNEWKSVFEELVCAISKNQPDNDDYRAQCDVIDMFGSSLYLMSRNLNENEDFYNCYQHYIRSYGVLIKKYSSKLKASSLVQIMRKMIFCLRVIDDGLKRKSCCLILHPVFLEFVDRMKKSDKMEPSQRNEVLSLLKILESEDVVDAVTKRISD